MTTDAREIARNLAAFYDFGGRTVVEVGAGGGQLIDYAQGARKVIAVDSDTAALARLAERVRERGLDDTFVLLNRDFLDVSTPGDVVLLEFCLHLMASPERALAHARQLAPDVVVIGHAPGSPWSWCAAEDRGVEAAWNAVERVGTRHRDVIASQHFGDYARARSEAGGPRPGKPGANPGAPRANGHHDSDALSAGAVWMTRSDLDDQGRDRRLRTPSSS